MYNKLVLSSVESSLLVLKHSLPSILLVVVRLDLDGVLLLVHGETKGTEQEYDSEGLGVHSSLNHLLGLSHDLVSVNEPERTSDGSSPCADNHLVFVLRNVVEDSLGSGKSLDLLLSGNLIGVEVTKLVGLSVISKRSLLSRKDHTNGGGSEHSEGLGETSVSSVDRSLSSSIQKTETNNGTDTKTDKAVLENIVVEIVGLFLSNELHVVCVVFVLIVEGGL